MKDNGIPTYALESGRKKLLIVDDDQDLVDLMRDGFERDGRFEIRTANNGFDAGMQVKEFRPDLVVLDVMLPDINGREVCQRVRSDRTMDTVKILCISGMVEADKIADLRSAGANDFMQKPFTIDQLIERVCDQLEVDRPVALV
jgi:DNA-binding response OmpR family regulator